MQSLLKSAALAVAVLSISSLSAQSDQSNPQIICSGETLELRTGENVRGEISWEFSTDGRDWQPLSVSEKE